MSRYVYPLSFICCDAKVIFICYFRNAFTKILTHNPNEFGSTLAPFLVIGRGFAIEPAKTFGEIGR